MSDADAKVERLILHLLRSGDGGWQDGYRPEHFAECPDVRVVEAEVNPEVWFDTGVGAVRLTARLWCPHYGDADWEWADIAELPDLIAEMDLPDDAPG